MSISNVQQSYISYNNNSNTSQYVIQPSYSNNSSSQQVIVSNEYNTTYQSYSIPQAQQISNNSYQNSPVNNQIISASDNGFMKMQNSYDNINIMTSNPQGQVYNLATTTQTVQQVYNSQNFVQSPIIVNQSNMSYQQPQSQIIINTQNVTYSEQINQSNNLATTNAITEGTGQNVLSTPSQQSMTSVILNKSDNNKSSEGTVGSNEVLPLFQKQPQQTINFSNSTIITNSPGINETSNTNRKNTCIYTPLQTPNSSPIKEIVYNSTPNNRIMNNYPSNNLAQEKNGSSVCQVVGNVMNYKKETNCNTVSPIGSSDVSSYNVTPYSNNGNSINTATSNGMLSPKSLSNDSSNQTENSSNNNELPSPNPKNNNSNSILNNNTISPVSKEIDKKPNQIYYIQGQNQGQTQITQVNNYVTQAVTCINQTQAPINNIPYQSPENNFVVAATDNSNTGINIINNSQTNGNISYSTYISYNNVLSPVVNQQYHIQPQNYISQQNENVQYISSPQSNVSYVQNVNYNQQAQNSVNTYQVANQPIYFNGQEIQVQQVQVGNVNLPVNYNGQYTVPYSVRQDNVISVNTPPAKVKRYKCSECGKRFSRPSSLKTHMYSHTGQHPFKCTLEGCGRRFSVLSNLRRHMKVCEKRHKKNRALILRNAKLSNSKICDDDEVNTTTITIDDINKTRVMRNKKSNVNTTKTNEIGNEVKAN
ncbi:hypothetical protein H8356DRAFT_1735125 [Neocallimastix lanati (nom. inval.)]|jgi:DNA-directed RNA polymerase subunit RPC12/RpoP|uniref:C2H2-type domain-containing protein n=1 Tax=Neocallimastix californiae TaxID=1754190 RepID=A0A1Y2AFJ1_9FUNG|nr:hypothetical protein H8356DRAFT_1735125 [Neocallimastix sp. JGI-2020a]ORY21311.1 hypothetical protein LY90DRAFT_463493 [Neocallimastix californiae]|eukprot:ORY21311.1 hypothetical protein LY90DRAFT_463493 [Neocallimastix californiae]